MVSIYSTLNKYNKQQLIEILKTYNKNNINISKLNKDDIIYQIIDYRPKASNLPPLIKKESTNKNKRSVIKSYTDAEQEQFLLTQGETYNPLEAKKEYFNKKTGKNELIKLLSHQDKFLRKFFLSNVSGCVVYHGVGTGKSLTASVASHYYLTLNPDGHIYFISPPALIENFKNALQQFGLDIKDNRYSFFSFDGFMRNKEIKNKKALVIIDEAHILRTQIIANETEDENGVKSISISKGKRGYEILNLIKQTDKCILLTGTPFINKIYDIENLLSMVTKKDPFDETNFSQILTIKDTRHDYFRYKISHYEKPLDSSDFPTRIEEYIPIVMNEQQLNVYQSVERGNIEIMNSIEKDFNMDVADAKTFTSFYNGTRQYSNILGQRKLDFIINRMKNKKTTGRYIIYTTFIGNGLDFIISNLVKNNFKYSIISGKENNIKKEQSKNQYNSGEVDVLVITKAGTEGIDTIATEAIFIYEGSSWNEPLVEQAIARAIRYKSHSHLPKSQQKVYVYRLLIIKPDDLEVINKINNKDIYNFGALLKQIKEKDKELKLLNKQKVDFDEWKKLTPTEKEKTGINFDVYATDKAIREQFKQLPSIEARLTILSLAKKQQVLEFIDELDSNIQQLENYESEFEKKLTMGEYINLSQKEIFNIQKDFIKSQKIDIFKLVNSDKIVKFIEKYEKQNDILKFKLDVAKRYQAYFTPEIVVKKMCDLSNKLKSYKTDKIQFLEPTCGIGNIPIFIINNYKGIDIKVNMVEIQEQNRKILNEYVNSAPDIFNLYDTKDFLQFINPIEYDLIIMNPPFHLRKQYFSYLDRDYYDIDFVKKCYYMLKEGGELIALTSSLNDKNRKWVKDLKGIVYDFEYKNWEDVSKKTKEERKASKIAKINLSIIIMYMNNKNNKETNKMIDPDLSNKQEQDAKDYINHTNTTKFTRRFKSDY